MYNLDQVISGLTKYIDNEILNKISGWQKWIYGAGVGIMLSKSTNVFNNLKENKIIKTLDLIDENNKIDIDTVYKNLIKEAEKGAITFDVSSLGTLTLTSKDVDKIYNYIKGNE